MATWRAAWRKPGRKASWRGVGILLASPQKGGSMRGSEAVWRALEEARRLNLADAGAAPPVAGGGGLTRRALLLALGATGASALLPRPLHAAPIAPGPVAIIGGGIAGLSALWHLTQAGIDAHLYEARARFGGGVYNPPPQGAPAVRGRGAAGKT